MFLLPVPAGVYNQINLRREQHKVEAIRSVPLSFVQKGSLLHKVFQGPGIHLQATDQVVHVGLSSLVVEVTLAQQKIQDCSSGGKLLYVHQWDIS